VFGWRRKWRRKKGRTIIVELVCNYDACACTHIHVDLSNYHHLLLPYRAQDLWKGHE
jgi:hypothetical protein